MLTGGDAEGQELVHTNMQETLCWNRVIIKLQEHCGEPGTGGRFNQRADRYYEG